ncbi:peptidase domain-containing ABC transporter [Niveispirillum irakense]|uniref:peptidase domain-containing ABC transporter n=1 Tax=Niveispirillum irakense TaxID=34011 RepID=UPI0004209B76|nr:peptidase domain-containing ABC transporter [Niveispirillum irakense]
MTSMTDLFTPEKFVRQAEAGECGLACLAMISRHYGDKDGLSALRRRYPLSARGSSLKDVIAIADQMGFHTRALKSDIPSLSKLGLPAVLHWDLNHYVVLDRIQVRAKGTTYYILDPARGMRSIAEREIAEHFTGIVLELTPSAAFTPNTSRARLRFGQLWSKIRGLGPALGRILVLSAIMQAVALAIPFYMQIAIDTALPGSDFDLLNIIALGFAGLLLLNAAALWVRSRLVLSLSNSLGFQTAVNLFRHTLFLPTAWFEKRHLGDISSRFSSLQPITDLLSKGLVSSAVDGILAISTLCLMVVYSPLLASLTVAIILVYAAVKAVFFKSMKFANANVLTAQALETSAFIENMRGIAAIKTFCQEGNRQRHWQNRKAEFVNGNLRLGRLTAGFETTNGFVVGIENIVFIYIAIGMVLSGDISLGMVFAFQAYKQHFIGATTRLVDQVMSYRLLDVHLERISDIALEPGEPTEKMAAAAPLGTIELQNVSFSYGFGQPFILKGVSMRIDPGRTTVLVGPSGAGKTTLFKILCGLLQPTSGRMLVDGIPLQEYGVRRYRSRLGVVSQDDILFSGSLAENIAFFDPDYDIERVVGCCRQASIHDDILKMPMKYETSVGDMGSNLSGGQKQRILLARALYQRPDMLMLDEGTAHLDVRTEARVVDAIKQLGGTRLLVAHRPQTIETADIVYQIVDGHARRLEFVPDAGQAKAAEPSMRLSKHAVPDSPGPELTSTN